MVQKRKVGLKERGDGGSFHSGFSTSDSRPLMHRETTYPVRRNLQSPLECLNVFYTRRGHRERIPWATAHDQVVSHRAEWIRLNWTSCGRHVTNPKFLFSTQHNIDSITPNCGLATVDSLIPTECWCYFSKACKFGDWRRTLGSFLYKMP